MSELNISPERLMLVYANKVVTLAKSPLTCRNDILAREEDSTVDEYELFLDYLKLLGGGDDDLLTNPIIFNTDNTSKFVFETKKTDSILEQFKWHFCQ